MFSDASGRHRPVRRRVPRLVDYGMSAREPLIAVPSSAVAQTDWPPKAPNDDAVQSVWIAAEVASRRAREAHAEFCRAHDAELVVLDAHCAAQGHPHPTGSAVCPCRAAR